MFPWRAVTMSRDRSGRLAFFSPGLDGPDGAYARTWPVALPEPTASMLIAPHLLPQVMLTEGHGIAQVEQVGQRSLPLGC